MPRRYRVVACAAAALLGGAAGVRPALAQFNFATFPSATGLNLIGNASVTGGHLRLTPAVNSQQGAAWYATPQTVAQGFAVQFTFQVNNLHSGGADGFAFLIQNTSATAIGNGSGGCTLGYDGIADSVAIEFDTYQTTGACIGSSNTNDPDGNHISVHTLGTLANTVSESASIGTYSPPATIDNGAVHTVRVEYVPGTLRVYYDNLTTPVITAPLVLNTLLSLTSGGQAWLGFTAATGGANEQHDILSWSFTPSTMSAPAAFGSETPDPIIAGGTGTMLIGVTRATGAPNSISSVTVNASSIGLSSNLALNDSGTSGDVTAGDETWSTSFTVPIATSAGPRSLPYIVTDAQGRTALGNISFAVNAPNPGDDRRPATPTIFEPESEGQIVNGSDVHMVTGNMVSPVGRNHLCSDWELYITSSNTRIWSATCVSIGALKVHVHLGDGVFEGTYAGRTTLDYDTDYTMRVRHRDDSGDPVSEYSYWAVQHFRTASPTTIFPFESDDIRAFPLSTWNLDAGGSVTLPNGASMVLGSAAGELLLRLDGTATGNQVTNPGALAAHVPVRVTVDAGPSGLTLGTSTIIAVGHDCAKQPIYLPAISLAPSARAYYWVTSSGSTYVATVAQTTPVFTTVARGTLTPWEVKQPGYVVEPFATNLQLPVNIALVPNPGPNPTDVFMYVTELYGQIDMITRNGTVSTYASNLLNYPPTGVFPGSGESGVTGVVVDPASGDLFATMLYAVTTGDPTQLRPKIVRMHSSDGGRTMATQTTLVTFPTEPQGQSHQISNISIGPDGKLYVHMGDGFDQTKGQDLTSARGKILRLNFDGTSPSDNPFYSTSDGLTARDQVWLYGIRNPFGGAWRASDGKEFTVENGPSNDRIFVGVRGQNYLYNGSDASMANFNLLGISTSPLTSIWYPAHGPVNIAFAQTATFGGSGFPADKMDHAYVTESGPTYAAGPQALGKRISEFVFAPNTGTMTLGPVPMVEYTGTGKSTCVAIAFGPDGLYFSDLYKENSNTPSDRGANILRVRYVGTTTICPACPGDFNGSGAATVQDIFDFLSAYFANDPRGDFNGVGGVSVQDIFDFLSAYFAGCP